MRATAVIMDAIGVVEIESDLTSRKHGETGHAMTNRGVCEGFITGTGFVEVIASLGRRASFMPFL